MRVFLSQPANDGHRFSSLPFLHSDFQNLLLRRDLGLGRRWTIAIGQQRFALIAARWTIVFGALKKSHADSVVRRELNRSNSRCRPCNKLLDFIDQVFFS